MEKEKFFTLDRASQLVYINRLAIGMGEKAPFNLNKLLTREEKEEIFERKNCFEEDKEKYFTVENTKICDDGEIVLWTPKTGSQLTGCYVSNEVALSE